MARRCTLLALCLLPLPAAWAHPDADSALAALQLPPAPALCDAAAQLRRGDIERRRRSWQAAAAAYDHAERCDPGLDAVDLSRAELQLSSGGAPERALMLLRTYLARHPESVRGRRLCGDALAVLRRPAEAAVEYGIAFTRSTAPQPDLALAWAKAQLAAGDRRGAVATLDRAISRLGAVPALAHLATDLDQDGGRVDAALQRIERLPTPLQRQPTWLVRRGELLTAAGRHDEAQVALTAALRALTRPTAAQRQLAQRAAAALERSAADGRHGRTTDAAGSREPCGRQEGATAGPRAPVVARAADAEGAR